MRRLLRWFFNLSAVLSAVLCVGALVAWRRSWTPRHDGLQVGFRGHLAWFYEFDGNIGAGLADDWPGPNGLWLGSTDRYFVGIRPGEYSDWEWCGIEGRVGRFRVETPGAGGADGSTLLACPARSITKLPPLRLALAAMPLPLARAAFFVFRWSRRVRRRSRGLCLTCGYDLRATPEEGSAGGALLARCPECGTVPATKGAMP